MENYKIQKVDKEIVGYEYKIYAINNDSPLEYLVDIEKDLAERNFKGYILFDLLLSNGNEYNRFLEGYFDGESFDSASFKCPRLKHGVERDSLLFFKRNQEYLDKGVLSSIDIFVLKEKFKII